MISWNRAPREVCRVYPEAEYLAGQEEMEEGRPHGFSSESRSAWRPVGLVALAIALLSALAIVLSEVGHPHSTARLLATSTRTTRIESGAGHVYFSEPPQHVVLSRSAPRRRPSSTARLSEQRPSKQLVTAREVGRQVKEPAASIELIGGDEFGFER